MPQIEDFKTLFNTLTLYKSILNDVTVQNFNKIINLISYENEIGDIVKLWSDMISPLYNLEYEGDFSKYINDLILFDKNYFTLQCASKKFDSINENIKNAAKNDIEILISLSKTSHLNHQTTLHFWVICEIKTCCCTVR